MTAIKVPNTRFAGLLVLVLANALALAFIAKPALAAKYDIQAKNVNYKYGTSAYIWANSSPSYVYQKVSGVVAFRTDWMALAEIGLWWWDGDRPTVFTTYTDYFGVDTEGQNIYEVRRGPDFGTVAPGSTTRVHTGYHSGDGRQYYWKNNEIVWSKVIIPQMTTQWPGINVERDTYDVTRGDNVACFTGLKYKNASWGSWSNWDAVRLEMDNDPRYKMTVNTATHVDMIFGY